MTKASPVPKAHKLDPKALHQQIVELTIALQRERADAINVRRRSEEDRSKLAGFYKAMVIRELLPAIDNLGRALKHTPKDLQNSDYAKGLQGVAKQFDKIFNDLGIERIQTDHQAFDPRYHEAVSMEEGQGSHEVISEELQAGYKLGDEVLRHAMVKVKMEDKDA
jgi:molecular chaperone GrpE